MTTPGSPVTPVLEAATQSFVEATANPPFLFDLPIDEGRRTVDSAQDGEFPDPAATCENRTIAGGPTGEVSITIYRPAGAVGALPVILYTHGAGWVFGDLHTHDRLVRELTTRAEAATVFVSYSLSPEARYPTAIEQIYAALEWIGEHGSEHDLDPNRIAVAGDSVGGNMTAALTLMAKQRGGPRIEGQLLYYPVTNAAFDTASYHQFATGYWLRRDAMQWFWDQYTTDPEQRAEITASALAGQRASARRAASGTDHRRRGRRIARRGRGLRRTSARGGCPRHVGALPGDDPRLRDAECTSRYPCRQGRHRPGRGVPPGDLVGQVTLSVSAVARAEGGSNGRKRRRPTRQVAT
jgi:acetyl esterase